MKNLSSIQKLKELNNIDDVNAHLKQGWNLLSIRETDHENLYVLGCTNGKEYSSDVLQKFDEFIKELNLQKND